MAHYSASAYIQDPNYYNRQVKLNTVHLYLI